MESLQQILKDRNLAEPDEFAVIKDYVKQIYKSGCSVKLKHGAVIVSVPNSGLAATLQLERQKMIKACNLGDTKLVIRNGQ